MTPAPVAPGDTPRDAIDRLVDDAVTGQARAELRPSPSIGVRAIAAERRRQVEAEGFTPGHDLEHETDALALAASVYACPPDLRVDAFPDDPDTGAPRLWPFEARWWKPTPRRVGELIKAGAMIAAEVDRLIALEVAAEEAAIPHEER